MTLADIALYAYTHVAHEGGFDLAPYPAIRAWLERVAASPGTSRSTPDARRAECARSVVTDGRFPLLLQRLCLTRADA